jgi:hypothetical protein
MTMSDADPTTEELRIEQVKREVEERRRARAGASPEDTDQHERRASKAEYLREKLEQRARAEREAAADDD